MGITFPTTDNGLLALSAHFVETLTPESGGMRRFADHARIAHGRERCVRDGDDRAG